MARLVGLRAIGCLCAAIVMLTVDAGGALGSIPCFHGIAFTKGCESPTMIGEPVRCSSYQIYNFVDQCQDTWSSTT
jgi:hypothetical protein